MNEQERKFGNETYKFGRWFTINQKKEAKSYAKNLRVHNRKARVIESAHGYIVFIK